MNENIIRRQQLKNMFYNLIAFALIFIIFGSIVFNQVRISLYSKLDSELINTQKFLENVVVDRITDPETNLETENRLKDTLLPDIRSPRVIPVLRDESGQIINFGSVSSSYYEQYLKYIAFDPSNLQTIVPLTIENTYFFRSLTVPVTLENRQLYLQLLINADSEHALLQHISKIILVSVLTFTVLSLLASYILSQKTMRPIKQAWNKQVEFVENVSHELRTPLTVIQNSLEMLLTTPQQRIIDKSENIDLVLNETARLAKMVTDLLTLARTDSSMTELSYQLFSLDMLVKQVSEPYQELAESQQKRFQLDLGCSININADRSRIHQLLIILLDNALKYTNTNDEITIRTEFRDNKACLAIADTGMGIGPEAKNKIFDRFYREDKARVQDRSGMGLGLSIAQYIVEKHGGTITVKNNQPKGTIFTFKLPIK